jgi:hypothetical protein
MPANEREWAKSQPEKVKNSVEDSEVWELTMTGDGYRMERAPEKHDLGWADVLFWVVVLVAARYLH